jgi:hypothetical protein
MARLELTLNFPKSFQIKTFNVKSEKTLSPLAKLILQSPVERDFLLQALYSTVISLQNNLSINFFDMWVYEIYINKVSTHNKFMNQKSQNLEPDEYITIKLAYGSSVSQEKK